MEQAPVSQSGLLLKPHLSPVETLHSLPAVVLDHVGQLDDELPLFVLLAALERVLLWNQRQTARPSGAFNHKH